jgi:hypothetical protein
MVVTDTPDCPHNSFELFTDKSLQDPVQIGSSITLKDNSSNTGPTFVVDRNTPTWATYFLKVNALANTNSSIIIPILFKVCGQETVQLRDLNSTSIPLF